MIFSTDLQQKVVQTTQKLEHLGITKTKQMMRAHFNFSRNKQIAVTNKVNQCRFFPHVAAKSSVRDSVQVVSTIPIWRRLLNLSNKRKTHAYHCLKADHNFFFSKARQNQVIYVVIESICGWNFFSRFTIDRASRDLSSLKLAVGVTGGLREGWLFAALSV